MKNTERLIFTILVAFVGAFVGTKLRIPAGTLLGSMIAVAVYNIMFGLAYMPGGVKFYTQIATGAFIGAKLKRKDILDLREIIKPAILLTLVMLCFTISTGLLIKRISTLTIATSLFAMAPAGVVDMTLASMDFDAEPSIVALIQAVRIAFTVCFVPFMAKCLAGKGEFKTAKIEKCAKKKEGSYDNLFLTLMIALLCGGIGKKLGVPSGAISFSMFGCAALNIVTDRGYMPLKLRKFVQVFAGALIGCTVGPDELTKILELYPVIILAIVSFLLLDIVAAVVISRWTNMDMLTALFSSAPGGVSDMALIAEEMGADSLKVAGMHSIRLIGVIACYPTVIHLLINFL